MAGKFPPTQKQSNRTRNCDIFGFFFIVSDKSSPVTITGHKIKVPLRYGTTVNYARQPLTLGNITFWLWALCDEACPIYGIRSLNLKCLGTTIDYRLVYILLQTRQRGSIFEIRPFLIRRRNQCFLVGVVTTSFFILICKPCADGANDFPRDIHLILVGFDLKTCLEECYQI